MINASYNKNFEAFKKDVKQSTLFSVVLHVLVALFIGTSMIHRSDKDLSLKAITVDLVALPDKALNATPPSPAPSISLKKSFKKTQQNILKKLKSQINKKNQKQILKKLKSTVVKGNKINKDNTLSTEERLEASRYLVQIKQHIRNVWSVPQWLDQDLLRVHILVQIAPNGNLLKYQIVQPSTNQEFDKLAEQTVMQASPYPEPSSILEKILRLQGIVFIFP